MYSLITTAVYYCVNRLFMSRKYVLKNPWFSQMDFLIVSSKKNIVILVLLG